MSSGASRDGEERSANSLNLAGCLRMQIALKEALKKIALHSEVLMRCDRWTDPACLTNRKKIKKNKHVWGPIQLTKSSRYQTTTWPRQPRLKNKIRNKSSPQHVGMRKCWPQEGAYRAPQKNSRSFPHSVPSASGQPSSERSFSFFFYPSQPSIKLKFIPRIELKTGSATLLFFCFFFFLVRVYTARHKRRLQVPKLKTWSARIRPSGGESPRPKHA